MSEIECILEMINKACSLAKELKKQGRLEDAMELLDGVARIEDRLLYLQQLEAARKAKGGAA